MIHSRNGDRICFRNSRHLSVLHQPEPLLLFTFVISLCHSAVMCTLLFAYVGCYPLLRATPGSIAQHDTQRSAQRGPGTTHDSRTPAAPRGAIVGGRIKSPEFPCWSLNEACAAESSATRARMRRDRCHMLMQAHYLVTLGALTTSLIHELVHWPYEMRVC